MSDLFTKEADEEYFNIFIPSLKSIDLIVS